MKHDDNKRVNDPIINLFILILESDRLTRIGSKENRCLFMMCKEGLKG